jgi:hypothetical protein
LLLACISKNRNHRAISKSRTISRLKSGTRATKKEIVKNKHLVVKHEQVITEEN